MTISTYLTGWALVHFVWQGALIAAVTAGVLRLLRGSAATTRYAAACVGLLLMLAAPAITGGVLAGRVEDRLSPTTLVSRSPLPIESTDRNHPSVVASPSATETSARVTIEGVLPLLVPVWLTGVALLALRLVSGAWRVRRVHRAALALPPSRWFAHAQRVADRLGVRGTLRVVDAAIVQTPTVVGWMRPIVLLPIATLASLSPEQVEAILAHELAHIRRHDYLVNLLQVLAETVLFYHPAVWWMSARIRVEREHCCDDTAIEVCGDPVRYAEALTELASLNTSHASLALAATSGSLLARVRRILGVSGGRSRSSTVGALTCVLVLLLVTIGAAQFFAAAQPGGSNDAVSTRERFGPADLNRLLGFELLPGRPRYASDDPRSNVAWEIDVEYAGGRMPFRGFTGRSLIRYAYGLTDTSVVDAPAWLDSESLHLSTSLAAPPTEESIRAAIRALLEQQLHLTTHEEGRDFPVYELVRADATALGPRLRPASGDCATLETVIGRTSPDLDVQIIRERGIRYCGIEATFTGVRAVHVTMDDFATNMRRQLGPIAASRPVVDRTGLDGEYDFSLSVGPLPAAAIASKYPAFASMVAPFGVRTIDTALREQLGLELEESTAPLPVLVVDRLERPSLSPAADAPATPPATVDRRLVRAPWANAVEVVAGFAVAPAQVTTGEVAGRAVDQLDNVLPAVEISLVSASGRRSATTDAQGDFTFSNVPPGKYTVFATLPGFRDFNIGVDVRAGATTTVTVPMPIGMIQEVLTVSSTAEPRPPVPGRAI